MPSSRAGAEIRAAGAVVWRPGKLGPDIALVHRPRYDDWSYPKGKCEPGEHALSTAIREVAEESGLRVVLGRTLPSTRYQVGGRMKRVSYWAARYGESVGFVPGREVDQVVWLPAARARERLSYKRDVRLLDTFLALPAQTAPVIVVRHALAGSKSAWRGDDLDRPLDARGMAQAKQLAELLSWYGSCQVLSSAAERCLATVEPYAAAVGVPVRAEQAFTIGRDGTAATARPGSDRVGADQSGGAGSAASAGARAAELAASGGPTLICAHRENLPEILAAVATALGAQAPKGPPLRKSEFWVFQTAGGVLVSAERHHPAGP